MIHLIAMTHQEIADELGVAQTYVTQVEKRALAKLRKSIKAKQAAELAGYDARLEAWASRPEWPGWEVPA